MLQQLVVIILFLIAAGYLGYLIYQSFQARSGCSSGCGSCGIDFSKIEKELQKKSVK